MKRVLVIVASMSVFLLQPVQASDDTCNIKVIVGDNMNFIPSEMSISKSTCPSVNLTINHNGTMARAVMGHNWVLTKSEDAQAVAQDGWAAGLDKQYLTPDDQRVIASTAIVGAGESDSITFDTKNLGPGGDYTFFCSFVGHVAIMKGAFTVTK